MVSVIIPIAGIVDADELSATSTSNTLPDGGVAVGATLTKVPGLSELPDTFFTVKSILSAESAAPPLPPAASIVTSEELFLVNVIFVPAVN